DAAQPHAARSFPCQRQDVRGRGVAGEPRAHGQLRRRQREPGHPRHPAHGADHAVSHHVPLARVRAGGGDAAGARRDADVGQDHGDDDVRSARQSRARQGRTARVRGGEMSGAEAVRAQVAEAVDRLADDLERLSHRIHESPELAFKEEKAHAWLTEFLAKHGARVERGVGGLATAFRATIPGSGAGPTIAIMAEYDALPGIGHACGHNVIATAGVGAGAALAALGTLPFAGRIQVIGTPAEEGGAGKVKVTPDPTVHEPLKANPTMADAFKRNLEYIDFPEDPDDGQAGYGSTDCGNVSQRLPTIHPYIRISPDGVPGHSREFAEWARSPMARTGMVAGAKALALTAVDLLASPASLEQAKKDFSGGHA